MSQSGRRQLHQNAFLVTRDGREFGGGLFYAPGKAYAALRNFNMPPCFTEVTVVIQTCNMQTEHELIVMHVIEYSEASGVTLLECNPQMHPDHMQVQTFTQHDGDSSLFHPLVGAPLVVCVLELSSQMNSRMGRKVELSVFPAYGCKLSTSRDHLLYDVRTWCGVLGAAIIMYEGSVVGMHMRHVPAAAAPSNQASIALLCHVSVKQDKM